jgi:hypothetical protein
MVEATKSCDINRGKCANSVKSTKFVKQILLTYTTIIVILGFTKQFAAGVDVKSAQRTKHTASRISWLHTRDPGVESGSVAVNFP